MSTLAVPIARRLTAAPAGVPWARITSAPGAVITNVVDDAAALIYGFRLWAVLAWTTPGVNVGSLEVASRGLVDALLVGGGSCYLIGGGSEHGGGGGVREGMLVVPAGTTVATVGAPGTDQSEQHKTVGGFSALGDARSLSGYFRDRSAAAVSADYGAPLVSAITGVARNYAASGGWRAVHDASVAGDGGVFGSWLPAQPGIVIARVPAHLAPPPSG